MISIPCVVISRRFHDASKWLESAAGRASQWHCGNCGEQAALAYQFLEDQGVAPLDYMDRQNYDHSFVVIGRSDGSDEYDPSTWGTAAVVCDPWHGKAYAAKDAPSKMYRGGQFRPYSKKRYRGR